MNIFGKTDYDNEDSDIKNVLTKMVNLIVIENESNLKNASSIQMSERTKRKLNSSISEEDIDKNTCKKYFNPFTEHHSWCPWLVETEIKTPLNDSLYNVKTINKNKCVLNFEALKKFYVKQSQALGKLGRKENDLESNTKLKACDIVNSDALFERIKSVQSILVNCTSQLSQQ